MRNQIALDAARGLEYIHEHTKTHYVHRDIKTSNILLDEAFRGKVRVMIYMNLLHAMILIHDYLLILVYTCICTQSRYRILDLQNWLRKLEREKYQLLKLLVHMVILHLSKHSKT